MLLSDDEQEAAYALMLLTRCVMFLINRMGMILLCSDLLIVVGMGLMIRCFLWQPASESSVM